MGVKDRRERLKQATRQGILDAAHRIARTEGWPALTIRKVADAIEYSPSIVYEYFESKEAILLALLQEGFTMLGSAMRHAQDTTDDPRARIERLAMAYWQFAREYPELYQVMHGFAGVSADPGARAQAAQETCTIVEDALTAWARATGITLPDPLGDTEIAWSLLHGLVSLTLIDHVVPDTDRAQRLMERALQALLAGWSALATRD